MVWFRNSRATDVFLSKVWPHNSNIRMSYFDSSINQSVNQSIQYFIFPRLCPILKVLSACSGGRCVVSLMWPMKYSYWYSFHLRQSRGSRGGAIKMSDFQKRQFISQLSWNMTGCWWMKQEGRGACVWQVVSGFVECLRRRAEQSGVPRNGHMFHLTLATWERLTFNFGFYLSLITVRDRHAQTSAPPPPPPFFFQSKWLHFIWNGHLKRWKAKVWSWIALDDTSLICFFFFRIHQCVFLYVYWSD